MAEVKDRAKNWSQGRVKHRPARRKQVTLTPGERRLVTQLVACLVLFGVVFIGRGLPLGQVTVFGSSVGEIIHHNTDFRTAFSRAGQSISDGEPFVETFGTFWTDVLGTGEEAEDVDVFSLPGEGVVVHQEEPVSDPKEHGIKLESETWAAPVEIVQEIETGLLPEEMVTPVFGVLTSEFGYRVHPVDGEYKHHDGIDIMADEGTPIQAFAAGEVEYIGESPAYGLYLQVKHSDGVSSFYAHCSAITVSVGQWVSAGEEIAKVGSTGNVTGAHLHFELKQDGQRIDPAEHVEYTS